MAYLKTILTYHMPSEAEVDKSLLESHGILVNLLNADTTRNELGAPFHIQLQVSEERVEEAVAILRQFNPQRFGSADNVRQIERELGRMLLRIGGAVVLTGILIFLLIPRHDFEDRFTGAIVGGLIFGTLGYLGFGLLRRGK